MPNCRTVDGTIAPCGTALVANASTTMKPFLLNLFESPIKSPKQNSRRITCTLKIMPLLQFMDISTDCLDGHLMSLLSERIDPILLTCRLLKEERNFLYCIKMRPVRLLVGYVVDIALMSTAGSYRSLPPARRSSDEIDDIEERIEAIG